MPFLLPNQQHQSTEGKFLITPTLLTTGNRYQPLKKIAITYLPMQTKVNFNASELCTWCLWSQTVLQKGHSAN